MEHVRRIKTVKTIAFTLFLLVGMCVNAQSSGNELPFRSIPDYPAEFTPATTVSRMIDALGFRYYWATEGLRPEDLDFQPSDAARTTDETLDHILDLCAAISSVTTQTESTRYDYSEMSFNDKRKETLESLKRASDYMRNHPDTDLETLTIKLGKSTFPFWNVINGQITDAIGHVGQVVSFRRSSGNPINPNVSVFSGMLFEK